MGIFPFFLLIFPHCSSVWGVHSCAVHRFIQHFFTFFLRFTFTLLGYMYIIVSYDNLFSRLSPSSLPPVPLAFLRSGSGRNERVLFTYLTRWLWLSPSNPKPKHQPSATSQPHRNGMIKLRESFLVFAKRNLYKILIKKIRFFTSENMCGYPIHAIAGYTVSYIRYT